MKNPSFTEVEIIFFKSKKIEGKKQVGVCHTLPFTLKSILRKKKSYGKLKYFTTQKYNL